MLLALRIYGCLTGLGGLIIAFATNSPTPLLGVTPVVIGCWSAALSQIEDPARRRRGMVWFAAAHLNIVLLVGSLRTDVWGPSRTPIDQILTVTVWTVTAFLMNRIASLAMANAKEPSSPLERQMRLAGAQEERNRLARDLHDSIKQQIFVIQTAAATAQVRLGNDPSLDQIRDSARDAMTEMEVMMDNLRSVPLENVSLVEALKKQCEALGHRTGANVELTLGEFPPNSALPPGSHQAIFRVAQEALANVGRHARATHVAVSLGSAAGSLELRIQDDGPGFDQAQKPSGMGVENMRARAAEFRGRLDVNSTPGKGATVVFSLPHLCEKLAPSKQAKMVGFVITSSIVGFAISMLVWKGHRKGSDLFAYYFAAMVAFGLLRAAYRRYKKAKL